MGSDYGCGLDTADIRGGARTCTTTQPASGVYTPGYHLAGTPTNGTCKPVGALSGTVAPTRRTHALLPPLTPAPGWTRTGSPDKFKVSAQA